MDGRILLAHVKPAAFEAVLRQRGAGWGKSDRACAERRLRMEGGLGRQDTVRQPVSVGTEDAGIGREVAQADGPSGPDDSRPLGENLGPTGLEG